MAHVWPRIFSFVMLVCACTSIQLTNVAAQSEQLSTTIAYNIALSTPTRHQFDVAFAAVPDTVESDDFVIQSDCAGAYILRITGTDDPTTYTVIVETATDCPSITLTFSNNATAPLAEQLSTPAPPPLEQGELPNSISTLRAIDDLRTPRFNGLFVGSHPSLALRSDGIPQITTVDSIQGFIRLITCNNPSCTAPTTRLLAKSYRLLGNATLALNRSNLGRVSYFDGVHGDFRLLRCVNSACSDWTTHQVEDTKGSFLDSELLLTADDLPVLVYKDASNALKLAICSTSNCSAKVIRTIVPAANLPEHPSLTLRADNTPIVSFYDHLNTSLRVVLCNDASCTAPIIRTLDAAGDVGNWSSLALTSTDLPLISYYDATNDSIKLARCTVSNCRFSELVTISDMGDTPTTPRKTFTTLKVRSSNIPLVSYYHSVSNDLMLATCNKVNCLAPTISRLDNGVNVGITHDMELSRSGAPVIAYHDSYNEVLKFIPGVRIIDFGKPSFHKKSSPSNNAIITDTTVILNWKGVGDSNVYLYCYGTVAEVCTDYRNYHDVGPSLVHPLVGLTHNTTYYWNVIAWNNAGHTFADNSTAWRFTVVIPPAAFSKTTPASNGTNVALTPTLTWAASTRATNYEYCYATTVTGCTRWVSTGTARSVTLPALSRNTTYYWSVRARNAGGTTVANSTIWQFTTIR